MKHDVVPGPRFTLAAAATCALAIAGCSDDPVAPPELQPGRFALTVEGALEGTVEGPAWLAKGRGQMESYGIVFLKGRFPDGVDRDVLVLFDHVSPPAGEYAVATDWRVGERLSADEVVVSLSAEDGLVGYVAVGGTVVLEHAAWPVGVLDLRLEPVDDSAGAELALEGRFRTG